MSAEIKKKKYTYIYRVKNNTFSNNAHYMYGQEYI